MEWPSTSLLLTKPSPPQYFIKRKRRRFGQKYHFQNTDNVEGVEILPDSELITTFHLKPRNREGVQLSTSLSEHEVNTDKTCVESCGVNHVEGGWPKDISYLDLEQTMRFRKKTEKDENYLQIILQLGNVTEHGIRQNNALDIYRDYFGNFEKRPLQESRRYRLLALLRDPSASSRGVTGLSWSLSKKLAVAYSNYDGWSPSSSVSESKDAFIWDVADCPLPDVRLQGPSCPVCIEFNPKDPNVVIAGCSGGEVAYWDVRRAPGYVGASTQDVGQVDCIQSVLWLNSKTGTEFFSASIGGQICWWDVRKLDQPMDSLVLDPTRGTEIPSGRPFGATCLEFEPTMSTKFMVGTEVGTVFLCNSKAKSIQEKLAQMYTAHLGNVRALQRNPMFPKNFLTVGDWTAKIWSEDARESPIIWTSYGLAHLTGGCWSPSRPSIFFTVTMNGWLEAWDLLMDRDYPVIRAKVVDEPLSAVKVHEGGKLVACGAAGGALALVELDDAFAVLDKNDKLLLTMTFDRETKRERILEARAREQRLRDQNTEAAVMSPSTATCQLCLSAAEKYQENLREEFKGIQKTT